MNPEISKLIVNVKQPEALLAQFKLHFELKNLVNQKVNVEMEIPEIDAVW